MHNATSVMKLPYSKYCYKEAPLQCAAVEDEVGAATDVVSCCPAPCTVVMKLASSLVPSQALLNCWMLHAEKQEGLVTFIAHVTWG